MESLENIDNFGPEARQNWITEYILQNGSVDVDELSDRFNVSRMTIHRDLDELDKQGVLRKVRGGATVLPNYLFESNFSFRLKSAVKEKQAIAVYALNFIESGQAILLDDSTTAITLARLLPSVKPLTVITNCLSILSLLSGEKYIRLIALGGEYMPRFDAFTGLLCENAIASLRANLLFMSTSAISGCIAYHQEQEIVKLKQAMMKSAARKILMVDHSKFGKVALHRLAPLEEFDLILVDSLIKPEFLNELSNAHIPYELAEQPVEIGSRN